MDIYDHKGRHTVIALCPSVHPSIHLALYLNNYFSDVNETLTKVIAI